MSQVSRTTDDTTWREYNLGIRFTLKGSNNMTTTIILNQEFFKEKGLENIEEGQIH